MSKFPSFLEYLNDKGNVVEKPQTEMVPDYNGPEKSTPPDSKVPYKTPVANKAAEKGESGLGDLGNEKLKYDPTKDSKEEIKKDVMKEYVDEKGKPMEKAREELRADYKGPFKDAPEGKGAAPYVAKEKKINAKKGLAELGHDNCKYVPDTDTSKGIERKTKTESFLNKTKGMSIAEFTKYMLEECGCGTVEGEDLPYVTAYSTGKIQPHPPETIRYISALAGKNGGILENLVSTMVSMGYLNTLLKTIFSYPQAYEELTSLFSDDKDGPARCSSFAGAMNNSYSKFLQDQAGLYESVSSPLGFEMEDEEDEESDEEEDFGEDDYEEPSEEEEEEEEFEDEDSAEEDSSEESDNEEMEESKPEEKRLKKKFAHDHLLSAMKNHEYMFKAMRGI